MAESYKFWRQVAVMLQSVDTPNLQYIAIGHGSILGECCTLESGQAQCSILHVPPRIDGRRRMLANTCVWLSSKTLQAAAAQSACQGWLPPARMRSRSAMSCATDRPRARVSSSCSRARSGMPCIPLLSCAQTNRVSSAQSWHPLARVPAELAGAEQRRMCTWTPGGRAFTQQQHIVGICS